MKFGDLASSFCEFWLLSFLVNDTFRLYWLFATTIHGARFVETS